MGCNINSLSQACAILKGDGYMQPYYSSEACLLMQMLKRNGYQKIHEYEFFYEGDE